MAGRHLTTTARPHPVPTTRPQRARAGEDQAGAAPEVGADHDEEARPPQGPNETVEAGGVIEGAVAVDVRLDVGGASSRQRMFSHTAEAHAGVEQDPVLAVSPPDGNASRATTSSTGPR